MKKLLSALLIATMLIASVTCALAVSAEETSPVIQNLLPDAAEGEGYKITANADGSVTIEFTADSENVTVATYTGKTVDVSKTAYVAVDLKKELQEGSGLNFCFQYTRADKGEATAQLYLNSMNADAGYASYRVGDKVSDEDVKETVVWNFGAYLNADAKKVFADNIHEFKSLDFVKVKAGDKITFYTLAVVNSSDITHGEPLVKPATSEDPTESTTTEATSSEASSSEASSTETTTPAASSSEAPASSSSTAPGTGDTGMIVFAILAVLAVVGGVAVVRVRH